MSEVFASVCDDVVMVTAPQVSVFGEALVDLIVPEGGEVHATFGGAPFNTARALARLGVSTSFVGSIAEDRFGSGLLAELEADGVNIEWVRRTTSPTTLALAELSSSGSASYRFYVDGTSAQERFGDVSIPSGGWMMTGGLGLVLNPVADQIVGFLEQRSATTRAMVDVNCRPKVISRTDEYRARVAKVLSMVDVVKVSDEDLSYLYPNTPARDAAQQVLESGPTLVLLTAGADPVEVLTAQHSARIEVLPVDVVDTVGAGDTFGAGFLAWWSDYAGTGTIEPQALADLDLVARAVKMGVHASAIAVGRRGADPPFRDELDTSLWG